MTLISRRIARFSLLSVATVLLAGCAASTVMNAQWLNPQAGTALPVKRVVVMGVSGDATARRLFEDTMAAALNARGVQATQSYLRLPADGPAPQEEIQALVRDVGADSILISRTVGVSNQLVIQPGFVMGPPYGYGWGGFYGWYSGWWGTAWAVPPSIYTVTNVAVDTRLFDVQRHAVLWSGSSTTTPSGDSLQLMISQFVQVIVDAMARDRAI